MIFLNTKQMRDLLSMHCFMRVQNEMEKSNVIRAARPLDFTGLLTMATKTTETNCRIARALVCLLINSDVLISLSQCYSATVAVCPSL